MKTSILQVRTMTLTLFDETLNDQLKLKIGTQKTVFKTVTIPYIDNRPDVHVKHHLLTNAVDLTLRVSHQQQFFSELPSP